MLDRARMLQRYKLSSVNGEIGKVKEFYFDDQHWAIRYLVADTGAWLAERQVLISPYALTAVSRERHRIVLGLTKREIEEGPTLGSDQAVSHEFEEAYCGFHGWPKYWRGPHMWGVAPYPERDRRSWRDPGAVGGAGERQLRSTREVSGYYIQTTDGEMGHVEDFIIDDEAWAIRYLIISTRNWWPGRRVLVSPQWIERVSWSEAEVYINLSRQAIDQAPEYAETSALARDYETRLHGHYNRRGYWVDASATAGTLIATNARG